MLYLSVCGFIHLNLLLFSVWEHLCFKMVELKKSSGFKDKRLSNLSIGELLYLLNVFNENEIYFFHQGDERKGNLSH